MPYYRYAALTLTAALAAAPLSAQTTPAAPASGKTVLQRAELPGQRYVVEVTRGVQAANARASLHLHPGIESGYVIRGGGVLHVQGLPDRTVGPGDTAVIPPNTPHWFTNGPEQTEIVATYVVENGKPASRRLDKDAPELTAPPRTLAPYTTSPPDSGKAPAVLQSVAFPGEGYYTRITRTEVPAQGRSPQHVHPGTEITYVLAGSLTLAIAGQPERELRTGDSFLVPAGTAHTVVNGAGPAELLSTYVLEEAKPVMEVLN
ncbi:cupin domain-containing protein [Massilia sp. METH4]|uniref:cupin domain-containing protein n=1 Tax=Massilia sp. METH4 TaxID=3123041 RepID=UPI0030D1F736